MLAFVHRGVLEDQGLKSEDAVLSGHDAELFRAHANECLSVVRKGSSRPLEISPTSSVESVW